MAVILDARYSKDEIFEAYLNEIYLGQHGSIAVTGVGEAARFYFGKQVARPRSGRVGDARRHDQGAERLLPGAQPGARAAAAGPRPARSCARRGGSMRPTLAAALAEPVSTRSRRPERTIAPHFVDFVKAELAERYGAEAEDRGAADLHDARRGPPAGGPARRHRGAGDAREELPAAGGRVEGRAAPGRPDRARAARPEPSRAFVGGRDYRLSQFNRVTQAHRQPGSLFKPFVFLAAFARRDLPAPITPATILVDSPITVDLGRARRGPDLDAAQLRRRVPRAPCRRAGRVELSINIPTVRAALAAGLPDGASGRRGRRASARGCAAYPSVALGAFEISPLEIAAAYAVLANCGVRVRPVGDRGRHDGRRDASSTGRRRPWSRPCRPTPSSSWTRSCAGPSTAGRRGARAGGIRGVLAGKTGTTNDGRDAWFVGFSPRFLAAIWVGYDDNRAVHAVRHAGGGADLRRLLARSCRPATSRRTSPCPPTSSRRTSIRRADSSRPPRARQRHDRGLHLRHGADRGAAGSTAASSRRSFR